MLTLDLKQTRLWTVEVSKMANIDRNYTRDSRPEKIDGELWFRGLIKVDNITVYKSTSIEKSAFVAANMAESQYLSRLQKAGHTL